MEAYKTTSDMGNNRQVLKDNISKDLRNKIESTKQNLTQLKAAIQTVDKNSSEAKIEMENAVETINQQLLLRKLELTKQIDVICQAQKMSLQEGTHTAYMRLGNLQSTLTNLDSFDNSQLLNLHVPETLWRATDMTLPTQMKTEFGTDKVTEGLNSWGNVSSTSSTEFLRAPTPSQRVSVESDVKSCDSRSGSLKKSPRPLNPLFPSNMISETIFKKRDSIEVIHKEPKDWQIEQWLSGMKIQASNNDSDDFEMISDAEPRKSSDDSKVPSLENELENCDGEDGSSIVCVETEELSLDDMSKWLKPKKKRTSSMSSHGTLNSYLLKSKSSPSTNNNQNQNRYLDFPCLRLDPNSWIQKRKKNVLTNVNRSELCLQVGQKEIIPPTYALPYPFWLKNYGL